MTHVEEDATSALGESVVLYLDVMGSIDREIAAEGEMVALDAAVVDIPKPYAVTAIVFDHFGISPEGVVGQDEVFAVLGKDPEEALCNGAVLDRDTPAPLNTDGGIELVAMSAAVL
jgi:hypothetical protein